MGGIPCPAHFCEDLGGHLSVWDSVALLSFFVPSLWISLFIIKGPLYLFVVCLTHEKQVHDFSQMCLPIVCRIESACRGSSINTCRISMFFISVYWYIPINPLSPCVNYTLINSPWCQSLVSKWLGEVTNDGKAGLWCHRTWDTRQVIEGGSVKILLPEPRLAVWF